MVDRSPLTYRPICVARELARLEGLLNDALWLAGESEAPQIAETLVTQLRREIQRLRLLQAYGETHDLPF